MNIFCKLKKIFLKTNNVGTDNRLKRDLEHEQRVTLEIEGWLNDRRIKLKELHKFWSEKLRLDVAQKDQELAVRRTQEEGGVPIQLDKQEGNGPLDQRAERQC